MKHILIACSLCLIASNALTDEIATTKSGKQVNLKDDGTWSVLETKVATAGNANSAISVVNDYLSVNDYDDRLNYILDPERIRPLRDEQNVGRTAWEKPVYKIVTKKEPQNLKVGEWVKIEAGIKRDDNQWHAAIYYLQKTKSGHKIDWESSTGYNKVESAEFKISKPTDPVRVRVLAVLSDYYGADFSGSQNEMYSVQMEDINHIHYGNGYVKKNSELGKKVFKALKNGAGHYMVFDIKSLASAKEGSHFLIHDVVATDSWLVTN